MNQTGERKQQENSQTKEQVQFEDDADVFDVTCCIAVKCENSLRPGHEFHHFATVQVLNRNKDCTDTQQQLQQKRKISLKH